MTYDPWSHLEAPEPPFLVEMPIKINGKIVLTTRWSGGDWEVQTGGDWREPTLRDRTFIRVANRNLSMAAAVAELETATQEAQRVYANPESDPAAQLAALDQLAAAINTQHALLEQRPIAVAARADDFEPPFGTPPPSTTPRQLDRLDLTLGDPLRAATSLARSPVVAPGLRPESIMSCSRRL